MTSTLWRRWIWMIALTVVLTAAFSVSSGPAAADHEPTFECNEGGISYSHNAQTACVGRGGVAGPYMGGATVVATATQTATVTGFVSPATTATPTTSAAFAVSPTVATGSTGTINTITCSNFTTQADAQAFLRVNPTDPWGLDADKNGIACENVPCPCDEAPVGTTTGTTFTTTPSGTAAAIATATATRTATATVTAAATATAAATPSVVAPRWLDRPGISPGAVVSCPAGGQWLLLYWGGSSDTPIATAADACADADLYWVSRQGNWLGYAQDRPEASDTWTVLAGEAHFVRGFTAPAPVAEP